MDSLSWALVVITVFLLIPIFVAEDIAAEKNREGWLYALLLGWIGVLVVALLPRAKEPPAF